MENDWILISNVIILSAFILIYIISKLEMKKLGLDKYHEVIKIVAPKGTAEKLRAYALIKGYKNEQELIAKLINDEIIKDSEKLNK